MRMSAFINSMTSVSRRYANNQNNDLHPYLTLICFPPLYAAANVRRCRRPKVRLFAHTHTHTHNESSSHTYTHTHTHTHTRTHTHTLAEGLNCATLQGGSGRIFPGQAESRIQTEECTETQWVCK